VTARRRLSLAPWLAASLAACSGSSDRGAPTDGGDAAPCTAVFRDNFAETWSGPPDCATVDPGGGHTTLVLQIPSRSLATDVAITIDLGAAPVPGDYSATTLTTPWQAYARHDFDMTACVYHAGNDAVPHGSFTLALTGAGDHPHGQLELALYVLSRPYTYCGETTTEQLTVGF
jgi:hypothetical protein